MLVLVVFACAPVSQAPERQAVVAAQGDATAQLVPLTETLGGVARDATGILWTLQGDELLENGDDAGTRVDVGSLATVGGNAALLDQNAATLTTTLRWPVTDPPETVLAPYPADRVLLADSDADAWVLGLPATDPPWLLTRGSGGWSSQPLPTGTNAEGTPHLAASGARLAVTGLTTDADGGALQVLQVDGWQGVTTGGDVDQLAWGGDGHPWFSLGATLTQADGCTGTIDLPTFALLRTATSIAVLGFDAGGQAQRGDVDPATCALAWQPIGDPFGPVESGPSYSGQTAAATVSAAR